MRRLDLKPVLGGESISVHGMARIPTPLETETWKPIPHSEVFETIRFVLTSQQYNYANTNLSITKGGKRLFGLMQIQHKHDEDNGYGLVFGFGNAHDKQMAVTLAMGAGVFICSNLSFFASIVLRRRHTKFLERDLEGLVHKGVIQLSDHNRTHRKRLEMYRRRELPDHQASTVILRALKKHIIQPRMAVPVWDHWNFPEHREFKERNVYSLLNAFTAVMSNGKNFDQLPRRTQLLHTILDEVCNFN